MDHDIKEKVAPPKTPPKVEDKDDALEAYQGQWGITFVHTDGRHLIDLDEHHDSEARAQARIDEAITTLAAGGPVLCVRTRQGLVTFRQDDLAYAYPVPLG